MSTSDVWLLVLATVAAAGCRGTECGEGTLERAGACVPAEEVVATATCGPLTELRGGVCVPLFPPTVCDPATTEPDVDETTGVTTCIGTSAGGCSAPLACPPPASGKQTICGQLYDFESDAPFAAAGASGQRCSASADAGPCALGLRAFDAVAFAMDPSCAANGTCVLPTGEIYVDDCGRFRVPDIEPPARPFIALAVDDAAPAAAGPGGVTVTTGLAVQAQADAVVRDVEAFVAPGATVAAWAASGGPSLDGGVYAMIYRARRTGREPQPGITFTRAGAPVPEQDHYFARAQTTRRDIDPTATATGANGTVLVTGTTVADGPVYSGSGLPAECQYASYAGAAVAGVLFVQVARPGDAPGETCSL